MYILAAAEAASPGGGGGSLITTLVMLGVFIAIFYFILIRPENKRKKQAEEMRSSLKVGDDITTIGGITGTICAVKEKTIVIESGADRVRLEMAKWSVSSKGVQTTEDAIPEKAEKADKKDKKEDK